MGPEQNGELFKAVAEPRIQSLTEEFIRRNLLATTMKELSELFDEKDHTSHPVTEPTLLGRLWALTQVQRTHLGIAGVDPIDAVNFDSSIRAKGAPHHDEFVTNDNQSIRTRIIKLTMPDDEQDDTVEIFGLNLYQPDISTDEFFDTQDEAQKLVIVGGAGKLMDKVYPITGETVAFAVRNKQTGDAKLYKVTYMDPESIEPESAPSFDLDDIKHETEGRIVVTLPDKKKVEVELLSGNLQHQMVDELQAAIGKLKARKIDELSVDERQAVSEVLESDALSLGSRGWSDLTSHP